MLFDELTKESFIGVEQIVGNLDFAVADNKVHVSFASIPLDNFASSVRGFNHRAHVR
jgi:hypothetical protein